LRIHKETHIVVVIVEPSVEEGGASERYDMVFDVPTGTKSWFQVLVPRDFKEATPRGVFSGGAPA
jgi:hypothetical protein